MLSSYHWKFQFYSHEQFFRKIFEIQADHGEWFVPGSYHALDLEMPSSSKTSYKPNTRSAVHSVMLWPLTFLVIFFLWSFTYHSKQLFACLLAHLFVWKQFFKHQLSPQISSLGNLVNFSLTLKLSPIQRNMNKDNNSPIILIPQRISTQAFDF